MNKIVRVYKFGRLDYTKCLKVQQYLVKQKLDSPNTADHLILVEHDPVYTVGIRKQSYPDEYLENLKQHNAQVVKADRGGLITFHGPGQLVAYPILDLKKYQPSLKWYVNRLEETIIDLCRVNFGLKAYRLCSVGYTGVWCEDSKIAAIGIGSKKYITYHGLALNCDVDLKWFDNITPCGIQDKTVSSLSKLLEKNLDCNQIEPLLLNSFSRVFNCDLEFVNEFETKNLIDKVNKQ